MSKSRDEAIAELTASGAPFELVAMDMDGVPWRVYRNAIGSLRDVLVASLAFGDLDYLVYEQERWTYAEHGRVVAGLAKHLADRFGIAKGERVAIALRNYPEWAMAFWATQALGAVAVPLNAWWTGPELAYALHDAGVKVLVADGERAARLEPHLTELGRVGGLAGGLVVRAHGAAAMPDPLERWEDVAPTLDPAAELPAVEIGPDDPATIMYTSGTTGAPKGALATHRNHATNVMNTLFVGALNQLMAGVAPAPAGAPAPQPAGLQVFPLFHIGGLTGLYVNTAIGAKLVLMYKWDTEEAIDLIVREQISATALVPTLLRQLLDSPHVERLGAEGLAAIASGGAPVPPDLIRRIESQFESRVGAGNGYGLTETTSAVIINAGAEYFAHPESVGRPVPGADLRFVDGAGEDVAPGEIGEVWVRGPNVVAGYWNKPDETADSFTDGWFHTGDVGRQDADGLVSIVDRLKDVVIRGGENVYCAEVEAVLFEHPAVEDVAIVGLPHGGLGEEVAAVVHLKPGTHAEAAELQQHAAARLARFKVPEVVVFRDGPLPRTATGKVLKRELREELSAQLGR